MIYDREAIKNEKIRVFDAEGRQIERPLLIDDVHKRVWSHPLLRGCPSRCTELDYTQEDFLSRVRSWQDEWGTVESTYTRMEKG